MNNFDKNWRNAKSGIFRLEGRAEYRLPGDWENFEKWKQGNLDLSKNKSWQEWINSLKNAQNRKVCMQRVKVVPAPLPDYIKYEIDLWRKYSTQNGEQIFFIAASDYQEIIAKAGFDTKDFWIFDDEVLLIINYDKSGRQADEILIANGGMINRYSNLKQKLLEKAVPMELFLKKLGY